MYCLYSVTTTGCTLYFFLLLNLNYVLLSLSLTLSLYLSLFLSLSFSLTYKDFYSYIIYFLSSFLSLFLLSLPLFLMLSRPLSLFRAIDSLTSFVLFFQSSESDLPVCSPYSVCGKLDTYGTPWLERQCRCPGSPCSTSTHARDGHTVHDRTKQYKVRAKR